jgi:hypothetical protein
MNRRYAIGSLIMALLLGMASGPFLAAQYGISASRPWGANVIVPQAGAFSSVSRGSVKISGIIAGTVITEQVAIRKFSYLSH